MQLCKFLDVDQTSGVKEDVSGISCDHLVVEKNNSLIRSVLSSTFNILVSETSQMCQLSIIIHMSNLQFDKQ